MFSRLVFILIGFWAGFFFGMQKRREMHRNRDTIRSVVFQFRGDVHKSVHIAGDFNNWDIHANPMFDLGNGTWNTTVYMKPGTYRYKFIADGKWFHDTTALSEDDGLGGKQSIIKVF